MKKSRFCFLALTALLALTSAAYSQQSIWSEQLLVSGATPWRGSPKTWQGKVYYTDQVGGYNEVYQYTQSGGSVRLLGGDGISRSSSAVWGDDLVVSHFTNSQYDLFLYNPATGEVPIATGTGDQKKPDIYQTTVVYEDHSGPLSQVMIWDEAHGSRAVCPSYSNQTSPKIFNGLVTWQDSGGGTPHVWKWDASGGAVDLGWGYSPGVYDGRIVGWQPAYYWDDSHGRHFADGYLWQWTAGGGKVNLASHQWTDPPSGSEAWGDLVVATGVAWDPVHGYTSYQGSHYVSGSPSVYGNSVAWASYDNNIYLSSLVPEPSSLVALGSLIGAFGLCLRRKGRRGRYQP